MNFTVSFFAYLFCLFLRQCHYVTQFDLELEMQARLSTCSVVIVTLKGSFPASPSVCPVSDTVLSSIAISHPMGYLVVCHYPFVPSVGQF